MSGYQFTPQAADDLFDIWSYIARNSLEAANAVEETVYGACDFLAAGPMRGSKREELTSLPLRFWTLQEYPNFIIAYDPRTAPIRIIRILRCSRNILAILGELL